MPKTKLEIAQEILTNRGRPLKLKEIAKIAIAIDPSLGDDLDRVASSFGSCLSGHISRTPASRVIVKRIPNGNGGFRAGMYGLVQRRARQVAAPVLNTPASAIFIGKAGEYGVFSELLYYGYNPAMMVVDDGIDIIASNNENQTFHIQVKTANPNASNSFNFKILEKSFERHENSKTFYVFVLRRKVAHRRLSDYVIMPSHEIRRYITLNHIHPRNGNISINISVDGNNFKISNRHILANINDFSIIK